MTAEIDYASLGWFPILFFTTLWVSGIYKLNVPMTEGSAAETYDADSVRAGARALFLQALVNIVCSIGVPFLIAESGILPSEQNEGYAALGPGTDGHAGSVDTPNSTSWKRARENDPSSGRLAQLLAWAAGAVRHMRSEGVTVPIPGLTLIRVWWISMFVFAACMAATWWV